MSDHKHAWPRDEQAACTPLAEDVCIWPVPTSGHTTPQRYIVAFEVEGEDRRQVGGVTIGPDGWTQTGSLAEGNLTLSPSLDWQRPPYRRHGWVRDGKWVEA